MIYCNKRYKQQLSTQIGDIKMPRRPRIDLPGYHHIINRGVNRTNVFSGPNDKEKFMQILCKACRVYDEELGVR